MNNSTFPIDISFPNKPKINKHFSGPPSWKKNSIYMYWNRRNRPIRTKFNISDEKPSSPPEKFSSYSQTGLANTPKRSIKVKITHSTSNSVCNKRTHTEETEDTREGWLLLDQFPFYVCISRPLAVNLPYNDGGPPLTGTGMRIVILHIIPRCRYMEHNALMCSQKGDDDVESPESLLLLAPRSSSPNPLHTSLYNITKRWCKF